MGISKSLFLLVVLFLQISVCYPQKGESDGKDNDLSFGTVSHFSDGGAGFMAVDFLSENRVVVVFRDNNNNDYGVAVIGTFMDAEISFGDSFVFSASNVFLPKVKTLNDSVFIVIYRDMAQSGKGFIIRGIVSNDGISFGEPISYSTAMISTTSLVLMDSTSFIIAYKDNGNNGFGTIRSGNIENGNIILGGEYIFNEATSFENVLTRFSDTTFLISYRNNGNGDAGTMRAGMFQNGEILFGEPLIFTPTAALKVSTGLINTTDFVVSYSNAGQTGEAVLGNYENGLINISSPFVFSDTEIDDTSIIGINDTLAVISFSDNTNNGNGTSVLAHIIDGSFLFDDPIIFNEAGSYTMRGTMVSDSTFALVFRNGGNGFSGSAVIGKVYFDPLTDIENLNYLVDGNIYPNPSKGLFFIKADGIDGIEVYNLNGQIIISLSNASGLTKIDLTNQEKGAYFINITKGSKVETRKVIID